MKRVMLVMGTRPETIKMAPVYHALMRHGRLEVCVCSTGQHRDMLDQMMEFFEIPIHHELNIMTPGQDLFDITSNVLLGMKAVLRDIHPDMVLIQGDTTTVMATAMAAFYLTIPVGHVEAGLRTGDLANPFPEEMNRCVADTLSALHFAPTARAREALRQSGIGEDSILVTGNTVVDALQYALRKLEDAPFEALDLQRMPRKLLLTTHRRESFGVPIRRTFEALRGLVHKYPDLHAIYPAHPNPHVQEAVEECLAGLERVHVLPPQPYPEFVKLMRECDIILTDSGGVQEEAPSLAKPVLVLRDTTERLEGIDGGTARLVGTAPARIEAEVARLLEDPAAYDAMARAANPYGDGAAGERIAAALHEYLSRV
jgi:UDP-N-acetylglucosamine 2-epimerase (non-hydrolysing)